MMQDFFKRTPTFVGSFTDVGKLPNSREPEVAFIGRSNVGKSSLINAIFRAQIARTSRTPGRTQTLNLFRIENKLAIVDLPGYGFAKVSATARRKWNAALMEYLNKRANLRRVFLLIDAYVGPKDTDRDMMDVLDFAGIAYQIILTKTDKAKDFSALKSSLVELSRLRASMNPNVLAASANTGFGLDETRAAIYNIASCKR